jgi:hypothetical protein
MSKKKYIKIEKLLKIMKKGGVKIVIEDRGGWYEYGVINNGEIIEYINRADNDPWDVVIPGYSIRIKPDNEYISSFNDIIGIFYLSSGNHKIFMRIEETRYGGYDIKKSKRDVNRYCKNYIDRWGEEKKISGRLVLL